MHCITPPFATPRASLFMPPLAFLLLLLALVLVWTPSALAEGRYQVQIGAAKDLDGTKWYAEKAMNTLAMDARVIKRGDYYIVVVGDYATREAALAALEEVKKTYPSILLSSYAMNDIIAAFPYEGPRKKADLGPSPAPEPERVVDLEAARASTLQGLAGVEIDGCTLTNHVRLDRFAFETTCDMAAMDPDTVRHETRHAGRAFVTLHAAGSASPVRVTQLVENKTVSTSTETSLTLRCLGDPSPGDTAQALRDLVRSCREQSGKRIKK